MNVTDIVVYTASIIVFAVTIISTRHLWVTRRQPVRKHVPTGNEPWVTPQPRWSWSDNDHDERQAS